MHYRQVGRSGLTVSALGLGCIQFGRSADLATARPVVDEAIEQGITLFDTAHSYGEGESERILGELLKGRRQQVLISTKFGSRRQRHPDMAVGSRRSVRLRVEECLIRLQTDYIDLYQLHFPDPATPIEETLDALDEVVREGKVRYIGSSNFAAWQIVEADWAARAGRTQRFVSAQREYGFLDRQVEKDVVPVCQRYDVGLIAWRPLGDGILAGRRGPDPVRAADSSGADGSGPDAATLDRVDSLAAFGREHGLDLIDVAIGGLAAFPAVAAVLVGARSAEHVRRNAKAAEWVPGPADVAALRTLLDREPVAAGA
jgi:aryl-alcohol dehydrogenase-like predicted oxidoreductase